MNMVDAQPNDDISHPAHYTHSAIECIEVTEQLSYNLGNAVKYVWRFGYKGQAAKDLRKAAWYMRREAVRCRHMWVGSRLWYWWKLNWIWHKYVATSKIPTEAMMVLTDAMRGDFADSAQALEALADWVYPEQHD